MHSRHRSLNKSLNNALAKTFSRSLAVISLGLALIATGCSETKTKGSAATSTCTPKDELASATVTWTANHEAAVNRAGGGYSVYYSLTSGFDVASATKIDVPYVSGATAPTTATIPDLSSCKTYYVKVAAYSSFSIASVTASPSQPSAEISITMP